MASNRKSAALTTLDSGIPFKPGADQGSRLIVRFGYVRGITGDITASTYRFLRVRSTDIIISMKCYFSNVDGSSSGAIATIGASQLGLYNVPGVGSAEGSVVDSGFFAGGITINAAAIQDLETAFDPFIDTGVADAGQRPDTIGQPIWQRLGLAADPYVQYDVTLFVTGSHNEDSHLAVVAMLAAA